MSTDRELLELAAKAAGIKIIRSRLADPLWRDMLIENPDVEVDGNPTDRWNPLHDDGDALRLAVKLELRVMVLHDTSQTKPWLRIEDRAGRWTHAMVAEFEAGPYAATRRAIVRAAAAIGKAMP